MSGATACDGAGVIAGSERGAEVAGVIARRSERGAEVAGVIAHYDRDSATACNKKKKNIAC